MQLSIYGAIASAIVDTIKYLVGTSGLEPPTSRLSGVCSNQLSYVPVIKFFRAHRATVFQSHRSNERTSHKRLFGGGKRDRTADPLLARQVLSQLSYTPKKIRLCLT